jgi:hypothetical protein
MSSTRGGADFQALRAAFLSSGLEPVAGFNSIAVNHLA